jgi:hypothetical protein
VTRVPSLDQRRTCSAERSASDHWHLIKPLYQPKALERITKRLSRRWPDLPVSDIEAIIAQAIDEIDVAMQHDRFAGDPLVLLWTIATRRASDCWKRTVHAVPQDPATLAKSAATAALREDSGAKEQRVSALKAARRLLPTIGHGSIVPVMAMYLDAVEADKDPCPDEVAAALHLKRDTVQRIVARGFERLAARTRGRRTVADSADPAPGVTRCDLSLERWTR